MSKIQTINDVLNDIRQKATTEKEKGTEFERLMKRWFLTDPRYENLEKVWLWEEFPGKGDLGGSDLGIDLVAKDDTGDYWAIQCKCYAENATIDKAAVDSFLANSSRQFLDDETLQTRQFSNLIFVSTTRNGWGQNALKATQGLEKPFTRINLFELESSSVNWGKLYKGEEGKKALKSGKQPRAHQLQAMSKAHHHFIEEGNDRGKLIMACGTGKTFTALRIMEEMTDEKSLVLFLVPSIALLGQTLNAWMSDKSEPMRAICVCSDAKATRKMKGEDDDDDSVIDLAVPATTNVKSILKQIKAAEREKKRTVIMSTYQSIDVVSDALHQAGKTVDLCICDEAHRTTGVKIKDRDESNFTKVHNDEYIPARKRLYMTATPRLYRESIKIKAKENDDILCSMDDDNIYGKEFYRLSFNKAVQSGLLTDYKVLVLTVNEGDLPYTVSEKIKKRSQAVKKEDLLKELNFDDATKLIGCINGLSKRIKGDGGSTVEEDPVKMRRAVAFCQTINPTKANPNASSTQMANYFEEVCQDYRAWLNPNDAKEVVNVKAQHIDGSMDANTRNNKIAWLKEEADDPNECRVLCNVRCLSEGVDVPALDAVLFMSPRNSEVEVVQSVGRVMRSFGRGTDHEKKYGYIIIPIIVPENVKPEDALNDNERFKVVWTILNALRSHDEEFNAHVNHINLNKAKSTKVVVGGIPRDQYTIGNGSGSDDSVTLSNNDVARQLELRFGSLQDGIYARIVEKVGDKMYWTNWAKEVGEIAKKFIEKITKLVKENEEAKTNFYEFVNGLKKNINPSVDSEQAIEMLAQHMITRPVFDALFKDYEFVHNNAVSHSMQFMIEVLEAEGFDMDVEVLERFYTSVRINIGDIDNLEGKQTIIKNLYEKFFKGAFPKTVDKLGIVYTPVECVDFIIHSVDDILRKEFNTSLTEENVHILDPFTGTGTFITRLLQSGLIRPEDMKRKYLNEIHCNEIVLLAYYIADVNIESVYHDIMKPEKYLQYDGICLTDTFQLNEHGDNDIFSQLFPENSDRVLKQKKSPVRVIIGNPPYSVGQKSANDNAQNLSYPVLDSRISNSYAANSSSTLAKSLYDSYIKAFRWASDRIALMKEGGIVAFISNGSWIDGNAQDGMRQCLQDEFTSVYVLNLRGNQRTSGELSRKEGGKIFGSGSRTPIAITILVKNPNVDIDKAEIYYHDIGDYLTREQKLEMVKKFHSINGVDWKTLEPNEKNDWINIRDGVFDGLINLRGNTRKDTTFFSSVAIGLSTNRDVWDYNFGKQSLKSNINLTIDYYNKEREDYQIAHEINPKLTIEEFVDKKEIDNYISWTRKLRKKAYNNDIISFNDSLITSVIYRPFIKTNLYDGDELVESPGQWSKIIGSFSKDNMVICVSGVGVTKDFTCIITNILPDLELIGKSQCFPLYWYEKNKATQLSLFDTEGNDGKYIRHDGITDWILKEAQKRYHTKSITKEMIFYYVYGILHSEDYRTRFASDLKKSLPRIPLVDDVNVFMDFYNAGVQLARLHLNYETIPPCPGVKVEGEKPLTETNNDYDYYNIVDKMRFRSKQDKSTILYNGHIMVSDIPEKAYEYIVNGKSAIDWIVERYCVSVDKKSLIKNDCNDWSREHKKPRYILDLLLSVINVSVQTVDIVKALPKLKFD